MLNYQIVTCATCGKEFKSYDQRQKYCSTPCKAEARKQKRVAYNAAAYQKRKTAV